MNEAADVSGGDDVYIETTTESYGERVKSSCGLTILGIVLFIGAFPFLYWNESRAVERYNALNEAEGQTTTVSSLRIDPNNEGRLVHFAASITNEGDILTDPIFGAKSDGLVLCRNVEMYQWVEKTKTTSKKNAGGSKTTTKEYSYHKEWKSHHVNSGSFKKPQGHTNPSMTYNGDSWTADSIYIGAYVLPSRLTGRLSWSKSIPVPKVEDIIDPAVRSKAVVKGNEFYFASDIAPPPPPPPTTPSTTTVNNYHHPSKPSPGYVNGYDYVGYGRCRDKNGQAYATVTQIYTFSTSECGRFCDKFRTIDKSLGTLQGYVWGGDGGLQTHCDCLFDAGSNVQTIAKQYGGAVSHWGKLEPARYSTDGVSGTGVITSVAENQYEFYCYKVEQNIVTNPFDNSIPTSRPTTMPTTSRPVGSTVPASGTNPSITTPTTPKPTSRPTTQKPTPIPTQFPTTSKPTSSLVRPEIDSNGCVDTPNYLDMYGGSCTEYSKPGNEAWCGGYGNIGEAGKTPNENCCECKSLLSNVDEEDIVLGGLRGRRRLQTLEQIGDQRVSFSETPESIITIVGVQNGQTIGAFVSETGEGGDILLFKQGNYTSAQMYDEAHLANQATTWIFRFLGWGAMGLGLYLLFRPLEVIADVLPCVGSIIGCGITFMAVLISAILSTLTISIAWLAARPQIGAIVLCVLLAVIGVCGFGFKKYRDKLKDTDDDDSSSSSSSSAENDKGKEEISEPTAERNPLDLNGDGKVDEKDAKKAWKMSKTKKGQVQLLSVVTTFAGSKASKKSSSAEAKGDVPSVVATPEPEPEQINVYPERPPLPVATAPGPQPYVPESNGGTATPQPYVP